MLWIKLFSSIMYLLTNSTSLLSISMNHNLCQFALIEY